MCLVGGRRVVMVRLGTLESAFDMCLGSFDT